MWAAVLSRGWSPAAGLTVAGVTAAKYFHNFPVSRPVCCEEISFSKSEFRSFTISEVEQVNHDTKILRCKLPSNQHIMGMTVSSAVLVKGAPDAEGKAPMRPYTPISTDDQKGYFELMVKGYPSGVVSKHLCSLKAGDVVEVKGPLPKLSYETNMKKHVGMVAGGSGITPMLQVLKEALKNPSDDTTFTLLFGNQTPEDILLREELKTLEATSQGRLQVYFIVDKNPSSDQGIYDVGHVNAELAKYTLPPPSAKTLVYVCGPPGMMKAVSGPKLFVKGKPPAQGEVGGLLKQLGYTADMVYKF